MKRVIFLLLALPLVCQARGGGHCHPSSHRFYYRPSFRRSYLGIPPRILPKLVYSGQSAEQLLSMGGAYTQESLVQGLALALAPKGNRMLPCLLDFEEVMHEGGFSRLLAEWEPTARTELLGYLQQLDCDDAFRITRDFLALSNPTPEQCERATQEFVDDSEDMNGVLWDFVHDHREAVAGL